MYRYQRIVSLLPTLCGRERRAGMARQPLQEAGGLFGQLSCWGEARAILPQCPAALCEEISHSCWCRWPRGLGDGLKQEQGLGQLWQRKSWGASSPHTSLRHGELPGMGEGWHGASCGRWSVTQGALLALAGGTGSWQARAEGRGPLSIMSLGGGATRRTASSPCSSRSARKSRGSVCFISVY